MGFFDTDANSLNIDPDLEFVDGEIVQILCTDFFENATKGSLTIKGNVLSGPHTGKVAKIYMNNNNNEVSKKLKIQFLKAFWTVEEINGGNVKGARLIGRKFSVKSKVAKKDNKTYQNWEQFHDLGVGDTAQQAQPAPSQSAASAPAAAGNPNTATAAPAAQATTFQ